MSHDAAPDNSAQPDTDDAAERDGDAEVAPDASRGAKADPAEEATTARRARTMPSAPPVFASAPGIGVRIGALHVSALTPLGWSVTAAGILGTLLIAVSYRAGWLSASLEKFGSSITETLTMEETTSLPLSWMYRIATLGLIGCAMALVFVPLPVRRVFRLAGFAAAGLSLLSAVIATFVIGARLAESAAFFGDPDLVEYGWGLYAGYLGIFAVTGFLIGFSYLTRDSEDQW